MELHAGDNDTVGAIYLFGGFSKILLTVARVVGLMSLYFRPSFACKPDQLLIFLSFSYIAPNNVPILILKKVLPFLG